VSCSRTEVRYKTHVSNLSPTDHVSDRTPAPRSNTFAYRFYERLYGSTATSNNCSVEFSKFNNNQLQPHFHDGDSHPPHLSPRPPHHSIHPIPKQHIMSRTPLPNPHLLHRPSSNLHSQLHYTLRIRPPPIRLRRQIHLLPNRRFLRPTTSRQHPEVPIHISRKRQNNPLH
jgi:hypothetical protein